MSRARRVDAFLPVLMMGAVLLYRFTFFEVRNLEDPTIARTPMGIKLLFLVCGLYVLGVGVCRVVRILPARRIGAVMASAAVAACAPYLAYGGFLMLRFPYWRAGGVVSEFLVLPILIGWSWGQQGVKELEL